jgi:branched-chain amino acid aminotransferase
MAHDLGYSCEFYLDAREKKYIDECGAANFFGIKDNTYITPKSTSILPSITNKSLMQLAEDLGMKVERRPIPEEELSTLSKKQALAVRRQSSVLLNASTTWRTNAAMSFQKMASQAPHARSSTINLRAIQYGDEPDTHGWVTVVIE